jgi:type III pantothenate kinase
MLLVIDAGNTKIKWALAETSACVSPESLANLWAQQGTFAHDEVGEMRNAMRFLSRFAITRITVANVAGTSTRLALTEAMNTFFPQVSKEWFVSSAERAGVKNSYRQPAQLGCDRFATAIAAHALYPNESLIIATCGTATTIDAVRAEGVFEGGMILPGLKMSLESLAINTAQLPHVAEHVVVQSLFADHTEQAIMSGCISAQVGAIERAVRALQAASPDQNVRCVIAGGAAHYVLPHIGIPREHIDNLVLIGLLLVAQSQPRNSIL